MGAYLGPIGMCLGACGPGKRLIVGRYLPSYVTHFFVFVKTDQIQVPAPESTKADADAAPDR